MNATALYPSVPATTPKAYLSGVTALNIPAPEGTSGDWHFLPGPMDPEAKFVLAGEHEDAFVNTNPLLSDRGVHDCTDTLIRLGYFFSAGQRAFAANHFRAICDRLVWQARREYYVLGYLRAGDYLDTDEQLAELGGWIDQVIARSDPTDPGTNFLREWRKAHCL